MSGIPSTKIESKTKKCDWCKKIKLTKHTYCLEYHKGKKFIICQDCNLKHDII